MIGEPLLQVSDLHVVFSPRGASRPLVALGGVSLSLPRAGAVAVVGESGSGKTTLARAILMLQPWNSGRVRFDGAEVGPGLKGRALLSFRAAAQMVFQSPSSAFDPRQRILRAVAEPLQIHGQRAAQAEQEAARWLARVGLDSSLTGRYPHALSGGQLQRAALARALCLRPRLLLADEPTSALDLSTQDSVLALLRELRAETGSALLLITHDLRLAAVETHEVFVLLGGVFVESGPSAEVLAMPHHPYVAELVDALPAVHPKLRAAPSLAAEPPNLSANGVGCAFASRCPRRLDRCGVQRPPLEQRGARALACWNPLG